MEIRLTILNENEIECFMNGTMPTIILKTALFNFKVYCIELSFARLEPSNGNSTHHTSKLVQVPTKDLNLKITGKAYFENSFSFSTSPFYT